MKSDPLICESLQRIDSITEDTPSAVVKGNIAGSRILVVAPLDIVRDFLKAALCQNPSMPNHRQLTMVGVHSCEEANNQLAAAHKWMRYFRAVLIMEEISTPGDGPALAEQVGTKCPYPYTIVGGITRPRGLLSPNTPSEYAIKEGFRGAGARVTGSLPFARDTYFLYGTPEGGSAPCLADAIKKAREAILHLHPQLRMQIR